MSTVAQMNASAEHIWQAAQSLWPGLSVEVIAVTDSTNSELMRRAAKGDVSPQILVALEQTAGRGRLGRSWLSSGEKSLTFSLGLPLQPVNWSGLSLAVGVSLAQSLHETIRIKWPNDLLVDGKKLAGILVETMVCKSPQSQQSSTATRRYAVIGVGINLEAPTLSAPTSGATQTPHTRDALVLAREAIGLRSLCPDIESAAVLKQMCLPLLQVVPTFEQDGFGAFLESYKQRDALQGLTVQTSTGVKGTALGVDGQGALLILTADGARQVVSGEVSLRVN